MWLFGTGKLIFGHHKMNYGTKQGHFLGYWKVILVYIGRWSYGRFGDENKVFQKMKNDLTTGTWQDDTWCPINIILLCASDVCSWWNATMGHKLLGNILTSSKYGNSTSHSTACLIIQTLLESYWLCLSISTSWAWRQHLDVPPNCFLSWYRKWD